MAMSSDDWRRLKAHAERMEQALEGLKALREKNLALLTLPEGNLGSIDKAIMEGEQRVSDLKKEMAN